LSDRLNEKLQKLAARQGGVPADVALDILEKWLTATVPDHDPNDLPYEEWKRLFDEWVNSHPKIDVVLDVSRESIYEGCGK
jgi:hypothetical protein